MMDEFTNNMESIASDRVQKELENRFSLKCPNCSLVNLADSRYCNECGKDLNQNDGDLRKLKIGSNEL